MKTRKSLEPYLKDDIKFYDHQVDGVRQMIRLRNFLLADEMGLGKSLQAIAVAAADMKRGMAEKILIVAPVTLKTNWFEEYEKFTRTPALIFGQAIDPKYPERLKALSPAKRSEQLAEFAKQSGPRVLIVNYEQVPKHLTELNRIGFDIIVFDEAHYLKNPKAARTKACHKLRYKRVFMLTGTPMLNNVHELWGLLHMIDPAAYGNYFAFVNRYCVMGGYKRKQIVGVQNEKELKERLNYVMIRRYKKDVLDLPSVQYIQKKVELSGEQRHLYDNAIAEMEVEMVGHSNPMEIENPLTKLLRLKQICGTTLPFTGEDISSKLDQAIEDAIEIMESGHKIVVFTQFRPVQEAFVRRLVEHGEKNKKQDFDVWELNGDVPQYTRQPIVNEWGADKGAGALVCMLQVAGIGLNMVQAQHGMFLDKLFVPGLNQQAVDRMHRIGQSETQPVQVIEYLCRGTVETRVEQLLKQKSKIFGQIVNESDVAKSLLAALLKRDGNAA